MDSIVATQKSLPFDLSPRDRLCGLPLPPDQRAVLVAVYDLAPDHVTWTGPSRELAAHMGCAPGTATRRAKRAAESGHLAVNLRSGRPGTYRLTALTPAVASPAPSAEEVAPTWSDLRASALRTVSLLITLVFGAHRRSARRAQLARRRRIEPLPGQLVFDFAHSADAPIAELSAEPVVSSAQVSAEVAVPPQNLDVCAPRSAAEASPIPFHSTVPPSPQLSVPTVPSHGKGGTLKRWWSKDIEPQDLRSPAAVQQLYREATAAGVWSDSERDRLIFFGWAKHVSRVGSIRNRPAVFTSQLGRPNYGKPFAARMATVDLDWATSAIKSLDQGPLQAPRTSDLAAGDDPFERERARQLAEGKRLLRERGLS